MPADVIAKAASGFRTTRICYLVFVLEGLLFFRGVLLGYQVIPWDLQGFHLPHAYIYTDAIARGTLPLWDSFTYCGRPFQANIQTETLYPTMALIALAGALSHTHGLFYMLELNVVLHTILAGILAFRLGRTLNLGLPAAVFLGSAYQMGAFFAIHAEHMGGITIAAWMPLAWAEVIELSHEIRMRPALLLAFALSMCTLGGLTPLTIVAYSSVVVLAILLAWLERAPWRMLGAASVACLGSLLLSLAQLGPTYELVNQSIARFRSDWLKSGGGVPIDALTTLILPNHWGVFSLSTYRLHTELTFSYLYSGLCTPFLAAAAVLAWRQRRHRIFTGLLLVTALATLGDSTWIGRMVYRLLPSALRNSLHPEFAMPAFLLCLSVLAALGLERFVPNGSFRWLLASIVIADLLVVNSGRIWNGMSIQDSHVTTRTSFEGNGVSVEVLRKLAYGAAPPWRYDTLHGSIPWATAAPIIAIPTADGNDPLALSRVIHARLILANGERWGAYYEPQALSSPALAMMNVKYLVSREKLTPSDQGSETLKYVADIPGFSIYENPRALPRFWLAGSVTSVRDEDEAWRDIRRREFMPLSDAVAEGFPGHIPSEDGSPGDVGVVEYEPGLIRLNVNALRRSYVATSEAAYPGWRAWVDGNPARLFYTNVAFLGLEIPAGVHQVVLRFRPTLFYWCVGSSVVSWLVWMAFMLRSTMTPSKGQLQNS